MYVAVYVQTHKDGEGRSLAVSNDKVCLYGMLWTRIAILVHCSPYSQNSVLITRPELQKKKLTSIRRTIFKMNA